MKCPNGSFSAMNSSVQGKRVFVGTTTGWVYTVNARDGKLTIKNSRPTHAKGINHIALTRNAKILLTCSDDTTAVMLSAKKLVKKRTYKGALAPLRYGAISPMADMLCAVGDDMILHVWMSDESEHTAFAAAHSAPITAAQFSFDGDQILTASVDGLIRIWAFYGQNLILLRTFMYNGEPALSAQFMPNNNYFIAKYRTGDVMLFEVATGNILIQLKGEPKLEVVTNCVHQYKSNGRVKVFSAGCDGKIREWDLSTQELNTTIDGGTGSGWVSVSASGKVLSYINYHDKLLRVFG